MDELWRNVLEELELEPSFTTTLKMFLSDSELTSVENGVAYISVRKSFAPSHLKKERFYNKIKNSLINHGVTINKLEFPVISSNSKNKKTGELPKKTKKISAQDLISKNNKTKKNISINSNLNSKFTFDNFIVGSSNDLAFFSAQAVAKNPGGEKYNPLYFYGGSGLGKTHLMQAIGNEIKRNNPNLSVLYITIENFYRDYLENVYSKKQGYAEKYRNVDVLIIDDMQFIAGKEKTQEEFFHTFNELYNASKQIIISSDRAPSIIPKLTDRLKSRFESGMVVDIQLPDLEMRQAIIEFKSEASGNRLEPDVSLFLAENIRTNIREIEGTVNQLLAMAEFRGEKPDIELAKGMIQHDSRISRPQHLNYKKIIDKTCKFYNVPKDDILSKSRMKEINHARQVACYLMKYELKMSFPQIGKIFSRDHSTIMNGVSKIEKYIKLDLEMRNQIQDLMDLLHE